MGAYTFDWSKVAFGNKSKVSDLRATFIAAPRELSAARLKQLIKRYLPKGHIVLGLAKEEYVEGFEGQPQFRMLKLTDTHQKIIDVVNASDKTPNIYSLTYFQREAKYIFDQLSFKRIVLINGSWKYSYHTQAPYYVLASKHITYEMVSPFAAEAEARAFEVAADAQIALPEPKGTYNEEEMLALAATVAKGSYDHSFQTGVALGKSIAGKPHTYKALGCTYNKVVPYQTFAMHYGASREKHFSPPHDLNHYDTVHAEVEMIIRAQKEHWDLRGTTLFINLLPCPSCSRMFCETDIEEFVYSEDHSAGYAVALLEKAGKKVRRAVPPETLNA